MPAPPCPALPRPAPPCSALLRLAPPCSPWRCLACSRRFRAGSTRPLSPQFAIRLTDLIGLQRPAYRSQIVAAHTLSRQMAQRNWTALTCKQLLAAPPSDLMGLISARMEGSAKNAAGHKQRNGRSSTGGPSGHMECRGYGPCLVEGVPERARAVDMVYDPSACAKATPIEGDRSRPLLFPPPLPLSLSLSLCIYIYIYIYIYEYLSLSLYIYTYVYT